jgi:hypothetical protein
MMTSLGNLPQNYGDADAEFSLQNDRVKSDESDKI